MAARHDRVLELLAAGESYERIAMRFNVSINKIKAVEAEARAMQADDE